MESLKLDNRQFCYDPSIILDIERHEECIEAEYVDTVPKRDPSITTFFNVSPKLLSLEATSPSPSAMSRTLKRKREQKINKKIAAAKHQMLKFYHK